MAKWEGTHDVAALAKMLRARLAVALKRPAAPLAEKRMFGGICFLLNGNMLCGAGKDGYMVRIDRADAAKAERLPGGSPVVMNGRAMAGFYWVDPEACDTKSLGRWLALAAAYVGALPAKAQKAGKRGR